MFKIYSLSKLQAYNTVLLTIVTSLYIKSSEIIPPITENLYSFTNLSLYHQTLATTIPFHKSSAFFFYYFTYKWNHTVFFFLYLAYFI